MASFFGLGGLGSSDKREESALMAHDNLRGGELGSSAAKKGKDASKKKKDKKKLKGSNAALHNAELAEKAAQEMQSAMSWWKQGPTGAADPSKNNDLSWLNDKVEDVSVISKFSVPDIEQFQEVDKNVDIMANLKDRKLRTFKYDPEEEAKRAKEIEERTNKMFDAVNWWQAMKPGSADAPTVDVNAGIAEFKALAQWWADNGNLHKTNIKAKRAGKIRGYISKYKGQTANMVEEAAKIHKALSWWVKNGQQYQVDLVVFEENVEKLKKVNFLFDHWQLKSLPVRMHVNPLTDPRGAERLAQKLETSLARFMEKGEFQFSRIESNESDPFRQIKHELIRIQISKTSPERVSEEVESILSWWRGQGVSFDPHNPKSPDDFIMFQKACDLFKFWGIEEPKNVALSRLAELEKEIRDSISFWNRNKDVDEEHLDPFELEKLRKIKNVSINLCQHMTEKQTKDSIKTIEDMIGWWRLKGGKFNPDSSSPSDLKRFEDLKMLYTSYRCGPELVADMAAKELGDDLNWWLRNNKGLDASKYSDADMNRFRRVQGAMQLWLSNGKSKQLQGKTFDDLSDPDAISLAKEMVASMEWFNKSGKSYDVKEFREKLRESSVYSREAKDMLVWLNDPEGLKGLTTIDLEHFKPKDLDKQAKSLRDQMDWFKNEGKNVGIAEIADEEKYEKAQKLAQWWNDHGRPISKSDAKEATSAIEEMLAWARSAKGDPMLENPARFNFLKNLFSVWSPERSSGKALDEQVMNEIEEHLGWWRQTKFPIDTGKLSEPEKAPVQNLLQLVHAFRAARAGQRTQDDASDVLAWTRESSTTIRLDSHIGNALEDVMGWFDVQGAKDVPKSRLPISAEEKFEKVKENLVWWERTDPSARPRKSEIDQLYLKVDLLPPLKEWWSRRGNEFAVRNGHMTLEEAKNVDKKLNAAFLWLEKNLKGADMPSGIATDVNNMTNALGWLRGKDTDADSIMSKSTSAGNKGAGTRPLTEEEKRAKEMEDALNWLRSNDMNFGDKNLDIQSLATLSKISEIIPGAKNMEKSDVEATMESALDWLRSNDDTKEFSLDDISVASWKKGRSALGVAKTDEEQRANEMASALDWLRNNNVADSYDVASVKSFKSLASSNFLAKIPESGSDADNGFGWLRNDRAVRGFDDVSDMSSKKSAGQLALKPKTAEELRAAEMASALDWLRTEVVDSQSVASGLGSLASFQTIGGGKIGDTSEMAAALNWLRQNDAGLRGLDDPSAASSRRLGGPMTEAEKKALEMQKALDLLKSGDASVGGMSAPSMGSLGLGLAGGGVESSAMEDALNWLRGYKGNQGDDLSSASQARGPRGPMTDEERKASEMLKALDLLKSSNASVGGMSVPSVGSLGLAASAEMGDVFERFKRNQLDDQSIGSATSRPLLPEQKRSKMDSALAWLRNNTPDIEDLDMDTLNAFRNLAGLPIMDGDITIDRKSKAINDAVDWLRKNPPSVESLDDEAIGTLATLAGIDMPTFDLSPEDKAHAFDDALAWLRANGLDANDIDDVTLLNFANLAGLDISPGGALSPGDKKRAVQESMTWLRSNNPTIQDVQALDDDALQALLKIGGVDVARRKQKKLSDG
jgi:hypothetical protein